MKARSAKQKGNRLEAYIAKMYNRKLDPHARRMPMSGAVAGFKADILKRFYDGWKDECKSRASITIYKWWEQTTSQCQGREKPVLHIKADHREVLTVIRTEDYFDMREELKDWQDQEES